MIQFYHFHQCFIITETLETFKRFKVFMIFFRNLILQYKSEKRIYKMKNKSDEVGKLGYERENKAFKAYFSTITNQIFAITHQIRI